MEIKTNIENLLEFLLYETDLEDLKTYPRIARKKNFIVNEPKRRKIPHEDIGLFTRTIPYDKNEDTEDENGNTPGVRNILKIYAYATESEREYWGRWYHYAHTQVKELAVWRDIPFPVMAAVVSVLSTGQTWKNNLTKPWANLEK